MDRPIYYTLDADGTPVPTADFRTWAKWYEATVTTDARIDELVRMSELCERLTLERDEARVLAEVRGRGCQCSDAEACAFVRERDLAREERDAALAGQMLVVTAPAPRWDNEQAPHGDGCDCPQCFHADIARLTRERDEARARIAYIVQTLDAGIPNDDNNRPAEALARDAVKVIATLRAERDEARAEAVENGKKAIRAWTEIGELRALLREVQACEVIYGQREMWEIVMPDRLRQAIRAALGRDDS